MDDASTTSKMRTTSVTSSAKTQSRLQQVSSHLINNNNNSPPRPITQRPQPPRASQFRYFLPFQSRWNDNDYYRHFNNMKYGEYFDSITNEYILNRTPRTSTSPIGLIVHSETSFASEISYPSPVIAAMSIKELGQRKVVWNVGLFKAEYVVDEVEGKGDREGENGFFFFDPSSKSTTSSSGARTGAGETKTEAVGTMKVGRKLRLARVKNGGGGEGEEEEVKAAAWGTMTHVFVDPVTRKVVDKLDQDFEQALRRVVVE